MMKKKLLKCWETAALAALSLALCVGTWAQAKQADISSRLVRLHVVAVSDDALEQAIKLRVRDAVLDYLDGALTHAEDAATAKTVLLSDLEGIANAAHAAAPGRQVTVTLCRENYPTREYEGMTLPAGSYDSLQIILGEGKGHNWWCVVFPPLCLSAAEPERMESVMGKEGFAIVSEAEGYELRLRTVELWGELVRWINDR